MFPIQNSIPPGKVEAPNFGARTAAPIIIMILLSLFPSLRFAFYRIVDNNSGAESLSGLSQCIGKWSFSIKSHKVRRGKTARSKYFSEYSNNLSLKKCPNS